MRKRPDIRQCQCGHQFPAEDECPRCGSAEHFLFMRAPERVLSGRDREGALTDLDPDWRSRFHGDVDLAWNFYREAP